MMNVFDFAMRMEEEHSSYYEKLAGQARTYELKEIFTLLADSERQHVEHLALLKAETDPGQAGAVSLEQAKNFIHDLADGPVTENTLESDHDGYRHAIKLEELSISLYDRLAAQEPNPAASKLLHRMADEERHHLEEMENIYDFVETPDTYLAWGEFSNLREY